jgi:nucleotide-binding universal stress UspA family protein
MSIVVGFIPTPEGEAALVRGAIEARQRHTSLIVVSSKDPAREPDPSAVARFEAELETVKGRLTEEGLEYDVRRIDTGRMASEDLLDVAEEVKADMIVIGLRRRSPIGKLILGSQAQQILLGAECPVLAVKAPR